METVLARASTAPRWLERRVDLRMVNAWVLCGALVLYLGFSGGGYAFSTYGQAGIVVWWVVVMACAWGLLPRTALSRTALVTMGAFGAFTAWTALGITWSISEGRSFQDLALVSTYFGILVLAVAIHRERDHAVRHTVNAVATAIAVIAAIALGTRLWPGFIPSARHLLTPNSRMSWPLDYWNALASLTVMGVPLLLSIATSARRLAVQALAAAAIPVVVLCGAYTQSRGGLIAIGVALLVWLACVPERVPKLSTGAFTAAGSAAVVAAGFHDRAIRVGLAGPVEHHQATQLFVAILFVCAGVGVAQLGIGRALRHATPPPTISPPRRTAAALFGASLAVLIAAALIIGVPHKIDHLWQDFKNPVNQTPTLSHLATTSGEGRYQYWVAGVDSAKGHELIGSGPGTFQLDWLPRAHIYSYVTNAHSLYVETYTELGFIGLALLALFILATLGASVRAVVMSRDLERTRAAAVTAALAAFFVGAAFDWLWQVPVLVAIVLLLTGAVITQADPALDEAGGRADARRRLPTRRIAGVSATLIGVAGLVGIAYPLAVNTAIANSQSAVNAGNQVLALKDARNAVNIEPGSAEAQIQLALVLERGREFSAALIAAQRAVRDESQNWTNWLTLSRIEAETGHAQASVRAFEQARRLNPESTVFQS